MDRASKLYQDLFKKYVKAHHYKSRAQCQNEVNALWRDEIKGGRYKEVDELKYQARIAELDEKIRKSEQKQDIRNIFKKKIEHNNNVEKVSESATEVKVTVDTGASKQQNDMEVNLVDVTNDCPSNSTVRDSVLHSTPAQDKLREELSEKEKALNGLYEARAIGLSGHSAIFIEAQIKKAKAEISAMKKQLKLKEQRAKASRKFRENRKSVEERLKLEHPEFAAALNLRDNPGKPRVECDQPELLKTILEIATYGSACGDRRRDDIFRTVKTLDDLHKAITNLGFSVSRSALYLKLLPRDGSTIEGKRHVNTVPVRLVRPQNDLRRKHPDRMFAAETSFACDKIATTIGPLACVYLAQDDKSSVFIGKTAAKVQAPILMNMRVRVRLPDHDFCVGSRHLLVPSVIAHCNIDTKAGVSYSGTTYIAVRSSKHNNSSAFSHQEDLIRFREHHPEVFEVPDTGEVKPVLIKSVDRGPDENPRYENNKKMACKTFVDFNLDCLIEVTQAPGHSAFNRAERKMFHLSKEMSGLVLPHDTYGSHLVNGKTVDDELEIKNFQAAGETLCGIWNNLVVDGYPTKAEYISSDVLESTKNYEVSSMYRSQHILETQYMTVILKCTNSDCCKPMKTNIDVFFPHRRIPALIPIMYDFLFIIFFHIICDFQVYRQGACSS